MRQHICKACGRIFLAPTTDTVMCPECAAKAAKEKHELSKK